MAQHAGSFFPNQGSNLCPLQWKHRVLTREFPLPIFMDMCVCVYISLLTREFPLPFFMDIYIYIYIGSTVALWELSLVVGEWGLLFGLLIVVASRCRAQILGMWASVIVAQGLWSTGSVVVAQGLSCSMAMWNLPGTGIEPVSPCIGRPIHIHCTTREVLMCIHIFIKLGSPHNVFLI